jgi:hypothetical protein
MITRSGRALVLAAGVAISCTSATDPFTSGAARATVTGVVADRAGVAIPRTLVHVACAGGGPPVDVMTDSVGRYITNLNTGSDPFDGGSGMELCHLTEPAGGNSRVQRDTALGFVRGPVLVALQFVDLREP